MIVGIVIGVAVALLATLVGREVRHRLLGRRRDGSRRLLVPFTSGELDPTVLAAAIRIAHAEDATLVPAYLMVMPWELTESSPMQQDVAVAMPLLEAVEHAALRKGVRVDARVETGRSPTHALGKLWDAERFDRTLVPAPIGRGPGFRPKDLTWILGHAQMETLILRPEAAAEESEELIRDAGQDDARLEQEDSLDVERALVVQ
ncbi:MAG: hypothetical protein WAQ33_03030 [Gaiellaceae bacterium]